MAMELVTGQEVWIAFACGHSSVDGQPHATVDRGVVIDGKHRVVKRDSGFVGVLYSSGVEQCHATEAAAWAANASLLERHVAIVEKQAQECRRAAAQAAAKAAVEVAA